MESEYGNEYTQNSIGLYLYNITVRGLVGEEVEALWLKYLNHLEISINHAIILSEKHTQLVTFCNWLIT